MGLSFDWREWRNRLIARPGFQRWAADFPLTRPIARRRARALFDITAGFVYSQILYACVELELVDQLAEGPLALSTLAPRLRMTEPQADRFLRAAVALDLLERRGVDGEGSPRFGLGNHGAAMLANPGIAAMVKHHQMLYRDLEDPLALLRGEKAQTELGRYWAYASSLDPAQEADASVREYSELMSVSNAFVAGDVLDAYSLQSHRCLMDVGGGQGNFLLAVAERWPHLKLRLFDLPAVAERAQQRFDALGLGERAEAIGGDLLRTPLPQGADICSLVRVVHDHDDDQALQILQAVRASLERGATLLLAEPMAETPGAEPIGDAYFGLYLLAMGSGRPRPPHELEAMLREAGFGGIQLRPTRRPMQTRLLVATAV
ncbi:methyltransferase [Halochromatium salexigens]|uniref:Methyltransferase n=1 Tax=Halochromatium salexigens TaxID=49447 RepID=A0AAJ0UDN0_HALSE|nr:methyltransferase [Halochromatium salexigens]MBK5929045.1 methyltransferase [Halochromatium salexigens]